MVPIIESLISAVLLLVSFLLPTTLHAAPYAFVSKTEDNLVSVLDLASNSVIHEIPVGEGPYGMASSPDGFQIYVGEQSGSISVIDVPSLQVTASIPLGDFPRGTLISHEGDRLYVSHGENSVSVIDLPSYSVAGTIPVGQFPRGLALSPDGQVLYASGNPISVIDVQTFSVASTIPIPAGSAGIVLSKEGNTLFAADDQGGRVLAIDTASSQVVKEMPVGNSPRAIALSPDGSRLYVSNYGSNSVSVIDTVSLQVLATVSVGASPLGLKVTPDGAGIYVANRGSGTVSIIEASTLKVSGGIPVGSLPAFIEMSGLREVGRLDTPGDAWRVAIAGDFVYLGEFRGAFRVIDISDMTNPREVAALEQLGSHDMILNGTLAYVAGGSNGLHVIDISNPLSPQPIAQIETPGFASAVAIKEPFLYVAVDRNYFLIYDISNPFLPRRLGSASGLDFSWGVAVSGDLAFLGAGPAGVKVFDISDPSSPFEISSLPTPGAAWEMVVKDHFVLDGDWQNGGLRVIEVADPFSPQLVASVDLPDSVNDLALRGDDVFLADNSGGLQIFDLLDPYHPRLKATFQTTGLARGIAISGPYVFLAEGENGLRILQLGPVGFNEGDPQMHCFNGIQDFDETEVDCGGSACVLCSTFPIDRDGDGIPDAKDTCPDHVNPDNADTDQDGVGDVCDQHPGKDDVLYGMCSEVDMVWYLNEEEVRRDFNCASEQQSESGYCYSFTADLCPGYRCVIGNAISPDCYSESDCASSCGGTCVSIPSMRNTCAPPPTVSPLQEVGFADTGGQALRVAVSGDYAYVGDYWNGLRIFDVSDVTHPREIGSVYTAGGASGVVVTGNYAYVANDGSGLAVVDITNPCSPVIVGLVDTPGFARDVDVAGNYAYVADYAGGLRIMDISHPAFPREVAHLDLPDMAEDVAISGGYAFVADRQEGLRVIDISNPAYPREIGYVKPSGSSSVFLGVAVSGGHAYVADYFNGLQVIDIRTPSTPRIVGSLTTPVNGAMGLTVSGSTVYIANGLAGLRLVDVSNPSSPREIDSVDTPEWARGVAVSGTTAYVADGQGGLRIMAVVSPSWTGSVVIDGGEDFAASGTVSLELACGHLESRTCTEMRLSNDGATWSNWEPFRTSRLWTLEAGDGGKTVYAQYRNGAGEISGVYSDRIDLDTVAPVVAISSPVVGITNDTTPLLSYTVSDGIVAVRVDEATVLKVSGDSLDTLADGNHTVRVEAKDAAGNVGSAEVTFTVQGLPPCGTPGAIYLPASSTSGQFQVSWNVSVTPGVTYVLEMASGGGSFSEIYRGSANYHSVTGLGDGSYQFRVKAVREGYADSAWRTSGSCKVDVP